MSTEWSDRIQIADLADEPELSNELQSLAEAAANSGPARDVVLNFGGVSYLNSSNIAQLLRLRATLGERGRRLRLCSVGDQVWSVMLLTGLDKVFVFAPDPATAIASLQIEIEETEAGA
ncbi:MAG: anti-sigma factor antagonist [Planctomycetota bacterium]|nr:MAG: anti-sigma factor antagonist [Planctomycetota bacterium]